MLQKPTQNSTIGKIKPSPTKNNRTVPLRNIHWWRTEMNKLGLHPTGTSTMVTAIISKKLDKSEKTQKLTITFQNTDHLTILVTGFGKELRGDTSKQIEEVFEEFKNRLKSAR
jgi:hypothetical protein